MRRQSRLTHLPTLPSYKGTAFHDRIMASRGRGPAPLQEQGAVRRLRSGATRTNFSPDAPFQLLLVHSFQLLLGVLRFGIRHLAVHYLRLPKVIVRVTDE